MGIIPTGLSKSFSPFYESNTMGGVIISWDILHANTDNQYNEIKKQILEALAGEGYNENDLKIVNNSYFINLSQSEAERAMRTLRLPANVQVNYFAVECSQKPQVITLV